MICRFKKKIYEKKSSQQPGKNFSAKEITAGKHQYFQVYYPCHEFVVADHYE
jgi:hypothetical protein